MNHVQTLPDVQAYQDARNLSIDRVGVTSVPYPVTFRSSSSSSTELQGTESLQGTVGSFDMFVSLPATVKGTHMSRFVQVLRDWDRPLDYDGLKELCSALRQRLGAETASITVRFPYFVDRSAPISSEPGKLRLDVELTATVGANEDLVLTVAGPAASLCPCSKEISDYGAHNQRCKLSASIRMRRGESLSIEELFQVMENAASTGVYPTIKRADEKHVTEQAYLNPKFVEDTVRDLALALKSDQRIAWFRCASENFESIHQHNAYAQIEMGTEEAS